MITVKYDFNNFLLDIRGHAEYAPYGKDIVCAAVSTLAQTLAMWLSEYAPCMEEMPKIDMGEGLLIQCVPKPVWRCEIMLLYQFVIKGMQRIAAEYPQNVEIIQA